MPRSRLDARDVLRVYYPEIRSPLLAEKQTEDFL